MKKQTYATEGALCAPGPFHGFASNTKAGPRWTGRVELVQSALDWPLRRKKPLRIFVNSMSDLFHGQLSDEDIAAVFGVMAACPQHTFQVLTKRPERMREWFEWLHNTQTLFGSDRVRYCAKVAHNKSRAVNVNRDLLGLWGGSEVPPAWPLPNVWLGVSVEDQATADERIPHLIACPAAVRFISLEPLLAPVNMRGHLLSSARPGDCRCGHGHGFTRCPNTGGVATTCHHVGCACDGFSRVSGEGIGGVIVGGESGPEARPCYLAWARSARDQCKAAGVHFFMKQLGAWPIVYRSEAERIVAAGGRVAWDDSGEHTSARLRLRHPKGGDPAEWPADLRVRETP